jgi:hypothetical protein
MPVAVGAGVLACVLVHDGIYGLTVVADTTSPVYWTTVLVLGLLVVLAYPLRLRAVAPTAVALVAFVAATRSAGLEHGLAQQQGLAASRGVAVQPLLWSSKRA